MNTTKTDREKSLAASEYVWDTSSHTEVHGYVAPVLDKWLERAAGLKLLDLGCGNGSLTSYLANKDIACTGCDFSESGIALASKSYPRVDFFTLEMSQALPREHVSAYDIVVSVEVIEHLLLPRQLFARAKEALKPGGVLILSTPYHGYMKNLALAITGKFDQHWHPLRDYGHVKFFSIDTLCGLLVEQGFEIESVVRVGRVPAFARSMIVRAKLTR